jgi:regulator of sirC expression with transglutaminase-like and TPR domain
VVELLVALQPGSAEDLRDRGVLYASLDCYARAAADLESYLALAPRAKDADELAARVAELKLKAARLN